MGLESIIGSLLVSIGGDNTPLTDALNKSQKAVSSWGTGVQSAVSSVLTLLPFAAIGTAAVAAATTVDSAIRSIAYRTGAVGEDLAQLQDTFTSIYSRSTQSAEQVSTAIGEIRAQTGLSGSALEGLAEKLLKVAKITNSDVSPIIKTTTDMFGQWNISTEQESEKLDYLMKISQTTGITWDKLTGLLSGFNVQLKEMGLSFDEAAAYVGKLEQADKNVEGIIMTLNMALRNFARQGVKDPEAALQILIQRMQQAKTSAEANSIAIQYFGRQGVIVAEAVRTVGFNLEAFTKEMKNAQAAGLDAGSGIANLAKTWELFKHNLTLALVPLGQPLVDAMQNFMNAARPALGVLGDLAKGFAALPTSVQVGAESLLAIGLAVGPLTSLFAKLRGVMAGGAVAGIVGAFQNVSYAVSNNLTGALTTAEGVLLSVTPLIVGLGSVLVGAGIAYYELSQRTKQYKVDADKLLTTMISAAQKTGDYKKLQDDLNKALEIGAISSKQFTKGLEEVDKLELKNVGALIEKISGVRFPSADDFKKALAPPTVDLKIAGLDDKADKDFFTALGATDFTKSLADIRDALGSLSGKLSPKELISGYLTLEDTLAKAFHAGAIGATEFNKGVAAADAAMARLADKLPVKVTKPFDVGSLGAEFAKFHQEVAFKPSWKDDWDKVSKQIKEASDTWPLHLQEISEASDEMWKSMFVDPQALAHVMDATNQVLMDSAQKALDNNVFAVLSKMGITSKSSLRKTADEYIKNFNLIKASGQATAYDIERAWIAMVDAQIAAGDKLPRETMQQYDKLKAKLDEMAQHQSKMAAFVGQQISTIYTDLSKGIADCVVEGKKLADVFGEIEKAAVRMAIEGVMNKLKPAVDSLSDALTGVLSKLGKMLGIVGSSAAGVVNDIPNSAAAIANAAGVGASAASTAASAASAGSSVAGTAASTALSSVTGIVGAVGAVGTMISSIIGNFQMSHMNTVLGRIEENTRKCWIVLGEWGETSIHGGVFKIANAMGSMSYNLTRMKDALYDPVAYELQQIKEVLKEMKAGATVTVQAPDNDMQHIAYELAQYLQLNGVKAAV